MLRRQQVYDLYLQQGYSTNRIAHPLAVSKGVVVNWTRYHSVFASNNQHFAGETRPRSGRGIKTMLLHAVRNSVAEFSEIMFGCGAVVAR